MDEIRNLKWWVREPRSSLEKLAMVKDLFLKICVFIDGLDEFEGDHLKMCRAIVSLSWERRRKPTL